LCELGKITMYEMIGDDVGWQIAFLTFFKVNLNIYCDFIVVFFTHFIKY